MLKKSPSPGSYSVPPPVTSTATPGGRNAIFFVHARLKAHIRHLPFLALLISSIEEGNVRPRGRLQPQPEMVQPGGIDPAATSFRFAQLSATRLSKSTRMRRLTDGSTELPFLVVASLCASINILEWSR